MYLLRSMDVRARRLGILETKLAQGAAMALALLAAKVEPAILGLDAWVYAVLLVLLAIRPAQVFFGPEKPTIG